MLEKPSVAYFECMICNVVLVTFDFEMQPVSKSIGVVFSQAYTSEICRKEYQSLGMSIVRNSARGVYCFSSSMVQDI